MKRPSPNPSIAYRIKSQHIIVIPANASPIAATSPRKPCENKAKQTPPSANPQKREKQANVHAIAADLYVSIPFG